MRIPLIVLAVVSLAGCGSSGPAAESTTGPTLPIPQPEASKRAPEVIPALATTVRSLEPEALEPEVFEPAGPPAPSPETVAEATATMDENAARLGDVVQRVDELVASALEIQKSLLMIYAEEEEEEAEAETETDTETEDTEAEEVSEDKPA
jgi:hypothetical protein